MFTLFRIAFEPIAWLWRWNCGSILSQETVVQQALDLPSIQRFCQSSSSNDIWVFGWSKIKEFCNLWNSMVLCLYEVGKCQKIALLDLYCEILEREGSFSC
ncbi:origin of replication complex subunit 3-like [Primulina eburnea]|uniref:origin of replication complex subunit 3-like n=1 Tax=Primulina eburnea TaxID=1245227 RepID=UPI003C6CA58A